MYGIIVATVLQFVFLMRRKSDEHTALRLTRVPDALALTDGAERQIIDLRRPFALVDAHTRWYDLVSVRQGDAQLSFRCPRWGRDAPTSTPEASTLAASVFLAGGDALRRELEAIHEHNLAQATRAQEFAKLESRRQRWPQIDAPFTLNQTATPTNSASGPLRPRRLRG